MILTALAVFAVLLVICAMTYYGVSKSNKNRSTTASTGNFGGEEGEVVSSSMMGALDQDDDLYEYEDLSIIETSGPSPSPVTLTISNDFEVGQPQSRRRRTDDDDDSEW